MSSVGELSGGVDLQQSANASTAANSNVTCQDVKAGPKTTTKRLYRASVDGDRWGLLGELLRVSYLPCLDKLQSRDLQLSIHDDDVTGNQVFVQKPHFAE
jgi:hypothetical protein